MFETDLRNLASLIIADAIKEGVGFEQRVDALKAATTFYGLLLKHKDMLDPAAAGQGGPSFLDFSEAVAGGGSPAGGGAREKPNGGSEKAVRTRAGRGPRGDAGRE